MSVSYVMASILEPEPPQLTIDRDCRVAGTLDLFKPDAAIWNVGSFNQPIHPHGPLRRRFALDRRTGEELDITVQQSLAQFSFRRKIHQCTVQFCSLKKYFPIGLAQVPRPSLHLIQKS